MRLSHCQCNAMGCPLLSIDSRPRLRTYSEFAATSFSAPQTIRLAQNVHASPFARLRRPRSRSIVDVNCSIRSARATLCVLAQRRSRARAQADGHGRSVPDPAAERGRDAADVGDRGRPVQRHGAARDGPAAQRQRGPRHVPRAHGLPDSQARHARDGPPAVRGRFAGTTADRCRSTWMPRERIATMEREELQELERLMSVPEWTRACSHSR